MHLLPPSTPSAAEQRQQRYERRRRARSQLPASPPVIVMPAHLEQLRPPFSTEWGHPFHTFGIYFDWRIERICLQHHEYFPEIDMHVLRIGPRSFIVLAGGICHHVSGYSENEAANKLRQKVGELYAAPPAAPKFSDEWLPVGEYRRFPGLGIVCRIEDVKHNVTCWILRREKPVAYEIQGDTDEETIEILLEESLHLLSRTHAPAPVKKPVQTSLFASL